MDAQLNGIGAVGLNAPQVDLNVPVAATGSHIVPILTGQPESDQQAQVIAAMFKDSIPQLPGVGPDWLGFLTGGGTVSFPELDGQVRAHLGLGGHSDYFPDYNIVNDALTVSAKQEAD